MRRIPSALLVTLVASLLTLAMGVPAQASTDVSPLKVVRNELEDAAGNQVHLTGVNRSGTEYACVQGGGIFDGPSDDMSIAAIRAWGVNAVRIGLNEDCWLGLNTKSPQDSGSVYRQAISDYVQRLHSHDLYAIVSLMWSAPGDNSATWQEAMADAGHALPFWSSVATVFRDDGATLLDLYSEPSWISWSCWVDGCTYTDKFGTWQTAGMQQMLDAVRAAGAHNVVLVSGTSYANDLGNWLAYAPHDPDKQLAASFHLYGDNTCHDQACWDATVREVAMRVPVVTAELGERSDGASCGHAFVDTYVGYARANGLSYLAWGWDTWNQCSMLIVDYQGTPTAFGAAYRTDISAGKPFASLPYTDARPSRPLFEPPEHERLIVLLVGLAVATAAAIVAVARRRRGSRKKRAGVA